MLSKYLNKSIPELWKMRKQWAEWQRRATWLEKPRKTQKDRDDFYENMPVEYMVDLEMSAQENADDFVGDIVAQGLRVLDFGCGTGEHGLRLALGGAKVDFFDLKTPATEFLRYKLKEKKVEANIYHDISKIGNEYDVIIFTDVLEHLEKPYETFIMIKDKLKKYGRLIMDSPMIFDIMKITEDKINIQDFVDCEHIPEAVENWTKNKGSQEVLKYFTLYSGNSWIKSDVNIFLIYNYSRGTTGDYIERALRRHAKVFTNREYPIKPNGEGLKTFCKELKIDYILQVDSGGWYHIPKYINLPRAAYSIDTFINTEGIKRELSGYDKIFYAQKRFATEKNEAWLPLGVDRETYKPIQCGNKFDIAFCGTFLKRDLNHKRNDCLRALVEDYHTKGREGLQVYIGRDYNEKACLRYCQASMVFNMGIQNDINMRLFEVMATGTPGLYSNVDGLADLGFKPDVHYINFTGAEDVVQAVYKALNDKDKRIQISKNAIAEIKKHTYDVRIREILQNIS